LAEWGDVSSAPDFLRLLSDNHPKVRHAALGALLRLEIDIPIEKAYQLLNGTNYYIRSHALKLAKTIFTPDQTLQYLLSYLEKESPELKIAAIRELAAGEYGPEIIDRIRELVHDPHPGVRDAAIRVLEEKGLTEVD